jgi:hypothetical protein
MNEYFESFYEEQQQIIEGIRSGQGTLEQEEDWVKRLREITPWFDFSDRMYYIELGVKARRIQEAIEATLTSPPSRELLMEWLQKALSPELPEVEQSAYMSLVEKNVPHPGIADLIYNRDDSQPLYEIIEIALNYPPISL